MLKLDILVHPTLPEQEVRPPEVKVKPVKKWRFPWRINMLARAKPPTKKKYEPPGTGPDVFKVYGPVDPAVEFRCDHLARPFVRKLYENRRLYQAQGPSYVKWITNNLNHSWNAIYNYYRKKLREQRLKRLKRLADKRKAKKPTGKALEKIESIRSEHLGKLATPKKLFLPAKIPRQRKALEDLFTTLESLAVPKQRHIVPPRQIGKVTSAALLYEITDAVKKLAEVPQWRKPHHSDPCLLGVVKKAALTAKCTPRVEKLAQPSFSVREARKHEDDKYDPWVISPNALKYKPSARILELAKPLERD